MLLDVLRLPLYTQEDYEINENNETNEITELISFISLFLFIS